MKKSVIQENLYQFPYHHIPHMDSQGLGARIRGLAWGYEYLCYQHHIKELIEDLHPSSILDVGCGDGYLLGILSGTIKRRAGMDFSEKAIRFAKAFHPEAEFRTGKIPLADEKFDVITAVEVLEHIPDGGREEFLREIVAHCRPGGHVILCVPTENVPLSSKHYRHYDLQTLSALLKRAAIPGRIKRADYVYRESWLVKFYLRLTMNRFWTAEIHILRRWLWKHIWERMRIGSEKDGRRLIIMVAAE